MTHFHPNSQKVIHDTLEGETVLINLETGNYYSMNPIASFIWEALSAGHAIETIVALWNGEAQADGQIHTFVQQLKNEELLLDGTETPATESLSAFQSDYVAPTVEKYDDMREMLLSDPIHDVEEIGWPKLK